MVIRSKTKKRIVILLTVTALMCVSVVTAYYVRRSYKVSAQAADAAAGIVAAKQGDHMRAIQLLRPYINNAGANDAEARYQFALSHMKIKLKGNRQIPIAMGNLKNVIHLEPANKQAMHDLLKMYDQRQMSSESISLAKQIFQLDPTDYQALRAKAYALYRTRQYKQALELVQKCLEQKPHQIEIRVLALALEDKMDMAGSVKRIEALRDAFSDQPVYVLLTAFAYQNEGKTDEVFAWLEKAIQVVPDNDQMYVVYLTKLLQQYRKFDQAFELVKRFGDQVKFSKLHPMHVLNLWQRAAYQDVIDTLAYLDENDLASDSHLLALKADAYFSLGDQEHGQQLLEVLKSRQEDDVAQSYASALGPIHQKMPGQQGQRHIEQAIEDIRASIDSTKHLVYLHARLAQLYTILGKTQPAIDAWKRAARRSPAWYYPYQAQAKLYLTQGMPRQARLKAYQAYRRLSVLSTLTTLTKARYYYLPQSKHDTAQNLLQAVEHVQKTHRGHEPTLGIYVDLLLRAGEKDKAFKVVADALSDQNKYAQATYLELARLSLAAGRVDLEQASLDRAMALFGPTPAVLLESALRFARQGDAHAGDQLIVAKLANLDQETALLARAYQLVYARYLDATDDLRAAAYLKEQAKQHPDYIALQAWLVQAKSVRNDDTFLAQTFERLADLGALSVKVKLQRVDWLMRSSNDAGQFAQAAADLEQMIAQTPASLGARRRLASVMRKLGQVDRAIKELEYLAQAGKNTTDVLLDLALLYQKQNRLDDAATRLDQVLANKHLSHSQKIYAVQLLAKQGQASRALTLYQSLPEAFVSRNPVIEIVLAKLYLQTKQHDLLRPLLAKLLTSPTLDVIKLATDYYLSVGDQQAAEQSLGLLGQLQLAKGVKQAVLADYYHRQGLLDKAQASFERSAKQAPENISYWQNLVVFSLLTHKIDRALQAANEGLKFHPQDPSLLVVGDHVQVLEQVDQSSSYLYLVVTMVQDAKHRQVAGEVLALLTSVTNAQMDQSDFAIALRQHADRWPEFYLLQQLMTQAYIQTEQFDEASRFSTLMTSRFPREVRPLALSSQILALNHRWVEALAAARQWRAKSAKAPYAPDMFIAQALMQTGNAQEALNQVEPYLQAMTHNTRTYKDTLDIYLRSMASLGRVQEAASFLADLLSSNRLVKTYWIRVAGLSSLGAQVSAAMLEKVESHLETDASSLRMQLFLQWQQLSKRHRANAFYAASAKRLIDQLVKQPDAPAAYWLRHASFATSQRDFQTAKASYLRVLEMDPSKHTAANNLADLLLGSDGDLEEARRLSRQAIAIKPNAHYWDTLAHIQFKLGEREQAFLAMQKAIEIQSQSKPANPALLKLFEQRFTKLLEQAGRSQDAAQWLGQVQ